MVFPPRKRIKLMQNIPSETVEDMTMNTPEISNITSNTLNIESGSVVTRPESSNNTPSLNTDIDMAEKINKN